MNPVTESTQIDLQVLRSPRSDEGPIELPTNEMSLVSFTAFSGASIRHALVLSLGSIAAVLAFFAGQLSCLVPYGPNGD
jgi:hypothetical protein